MSIKHMPPGSTFDAPAGEAPPAPPVYAIGARLRVRSDSRAGRKSPHVGDVGTVVAVTPKRESYVVFLNCLDRVYTLDFGPDDDGPGGRDTWGYADADLCPADAPAPQTHRRTKNKQ